MKTITFYSYKGGVGRSLALREIARRLSEFKKKVCVLDFDLEAPGLHYKFEQQYPKVRNFKTGIVDYIHDFISTGKIPENISNYKITLPAPNVNFSDIDFIPAGDPTSNEYWKKLSAINWHEFLYQKDGIRFFLDMKARIEKEIKPDCLLIDSRTGITDISGITLRLLSDEIVVLAVNNKENLHGCATIINNLSNVNNSISEREPKIHFVLSRLSYNQNKQEDILEEAQVLASVRHFLEEKTNWRFNILTIHREEHIERNENQNLIYDDDLPSDRKNRRAIKSSITNDYLILFDKITEDIFKPDEKKRILDAKMSSKFLEEAKTEGNHAQRLEKLKKAISYDPNNYEAYVERALQHFRMANYDEAKKDLEKIIEINPGHVWAYVNLAIIFNRKGMLDKSKEFLDKALTIDPYSEMANLSLYDLYEDMNEHEKAVNILNLILEKVNPENPDALNSRANYYRRKGKLDEALQDIKKAIEVNTNNAVYYGTLAEIYAEMDKMDEFYFFLSVALRKGISAIELSTAVDVYEKFKNEPRFIELMNKYQIDLDILFSETK